MVEWPCCYDPLRLSLGSYDLFFTNISPPLSLLARSLWVTEVDEPHNRPVLCWGTEVQCGKVYWVTEVQHEKLCWVTEDHCDSPPPALVAPSPRRPFGVLCSSVPQSDFHSHPPLAEDAPSFWASPSDLRHRVVARSLALLGLMWQSQ